MSENIIFLKFLIIAIPFLQQLCGPAPASTCQEAVYLGLLRPRLRLRSLDHTDSSHGDQADDVLSTATAHAKCGEWLEEVQCQ